jgi:hypothetical protein
MNAVTDMSRGSRMNPVPPPLSPGRLKASLRLVLAVALGAITLGPILAGLSGCSGDTTGPKTKEKIAVYGNLYVGESVGGEAGVLVTRVKPILQHYDINEAGVTDAVVTLRREGSTRIDTLSRESGDWPGYYKNRGVRIEARATYHLQVEVPGQNVITATTTTPDTLVFYSEPRVSPGTMRHAVIPDSFPIVIGCRNPDQILLVDVYCEEDWSTARYLEPFGGQKTPNDYQEYGGDDGQPRHIFGYMRYQDLEKRGSVSLVNFYDAMMVFWGRYTVTVASIDENAYNYLYRDHPEENGGIVGGIGLFGSAHRRAYEVEIVE